MSIIDSNSPHPGLQRANPATTRAASPVSSIQDVANTTLTDVSIHLSEQPLELLYQSVMQNLNGQLAPSLGKQVTLTVAGPGLDFSREATARRIVSMASGFYPTFRRQYPELGDDTGLERFLDIVSEGINQGFSEVRDILQGLKVLDGNIAANIIDRTYGSVQQGLERFRLANSKT